jgi:hypothetical protein
VRVVDRSLCDSSSQHSGTFLDPSVTVFGKKGFFDIYHPLYSVYITPADFQLFSKFKECAERKPFLGLEGICGKKIVRRFLFRILETVLENG